MGWSQASLYPTSEGSPYEPFDPTSEIIWGQLQVLSDLLGDPDATGWAIVATERCLQPHLPPLDVLKTKTRTLRKGDEVDLEAAWRRRWLNSVTSGSRPLSRRGPGADAATSSTSFR